MLRPAGLGAPEDLVPTTGRDLTQALYVAAVALGCTRDAEDAIGLIRAAAEWANGRSPGKNTLTTRQR
jgi:hypothetical protein